MLPLVGFFVIWSQYRVSECEKCVDNIFFCLKFCSQFFVLVLVLFCLFVGVGWDFVSVLFHSGVFFASQVMGLYCVEEMELTIINLLHEFVEFVMCSSHIMNI